VKRITRFLEQDRSAVGRKYAGTAAGAAGTRGMPMAERTQAKITAPKDLLVRNPLFAQIGPDELERMAALFRRRRYRGGEPVFREGDPGTALYIIESGEVKILLGGSEGKEVVLSLLAPGEFFGELALLDGEPRSADAVTTTPTELLVLPRDEFLRFLREMPSVAINMLAALSRRFRRTDRLVHDAAFSDVHTRVTRVLLELGETRGTPERGGIVIEPHLTQGDLADMVGATRESINKCLRSYAAQGIVRHERGRLVLLNIERLRAQLV
jgi:CRP/FNR family transcriptional regulator, cyclic AMP receptor protein